MEDRLGLWGEGFQFHALGLSGGWLSVDFFINCLIISCFDKE